MFNVHMLEILKIVNHRKFIIEYFGLEVSWIGSLTTVLCLFELSWALKASTRTNRPLRPFTDESLLIRKSTHSIRWATI